MQSIRYIISKFKAKPQNITKIKYSKRTMMWASTT